LAPAQRSDSVPTFSRDPDCKSKTGSRGRRSLKLP